MSHNFFMFFITYNLYFLFGILIIFIILFFLVHSFFSLFLLQSITTTASTTYRFQAGINQRRARDAVRPVLPSPRGAHDVVEGESPVQLPEAATAVHERRHSHHVRLETSCSHVIQHLKGSRNLAYFIFLIIFQFIF